MFAIDNKLVIAVASSALFDLSESDRVFREEGAEAYKAYQIGHQQDYLKPGVAFAFVKRFLHLNQVFDQEQPVEVVLLSRNSSETGLRVFNSIAHHGLPISRAAFMRGQDPYPYIPAFNAALFLSANQADVNKAIALGYPAGMVMAGSTFEDEEDLDFKVAFDFDGVVADDESERVYKTQDLQAFVQHESLHAQTPHNPGPLADFFRKLGRLQQLAHAQGKEEALRIAIVTARSAPAHERVVTTLRALGIEPDETFFLGGMSKVRVLETMRPHLFFDDQVSHLVSTSGKLSLAHIPFGIANRIELNRSVARGH
jgi:5'-nucleotidase